VPAVTTTSAGKTTAGAIAAGKAVIGKAVAGKAPAAGTTPAGTTPAGGTAPAGTPSAGTTPAGATPTATTSVVAPAPGAPVPTTAPATLPPPAHPDGDYLIVGTDAFPVTGVFCDVLGAGAGGSSSVESEIREIDGDAEGLGPFFYQIDSRGLGRFSVASTAGNGTVFFSAGDLVVDAPLIGPAVLLGGKGALDPDNTLSDYRAALDSAIGADRMAEINAGAAPTTAEQATILQLHNQYYSTPFSLSVAC
jgi:hypothetical protein